MRPAKALETKSFFFVYLTMALIALVSDWSQRGDLWASWRLAANASSPSWSLAAAIFCGFAIMLYATTATWRSAMDLERVLQQILTPFSYFQMALLALVGALVEEWFFRGILQYRFGLFFTAFVYGLAHFIAVPQIWLWAILSLCLGLLFGILFKNSQSLIFVCAVHFGINFILLWKLNQQAHRNSASQVFR